MIRRHIFLAWFLLLVAASSVADEPREVTLVLVSAGDLGGSQLTPNQLRRVFLGIPLSVGGQHIRALRNTSDPLLNEIFLQKVVYMSERRYQRQLVSLTFRTGRVRPPRFDRRDALVRALKSTPGSVSVMWERDARAVPDLHVIQVLWKGHAR